MNFNPKKALSKLGIKQLNSMQVAFHKACATNANNLLLAPTGTGKTLAFLFPILEQVDADLPQVQALIIVPSRELALQIEGVIKELKLGIKVTACYGGHPMRIETNNLKNPPTIIVGTPGRLADHLSKDTIDPSHIKTLVIDEYDKSLELGFGKDLARISSTLTNLNHRYFTSATSLETIPSFTGFNNPTIVDFSETKKPTQLKFRLVTAESTEKPSILLELLQHIGDEPTLVFCNHREAVNRLSELFKQNNVPHDSFHGGREQYDREKALIKFRNGSIHYLICTDLAARGLDIPEITSIIHYQLPEKLDAFIHRNGRTARMHEKGTAYFIATELEDLPDYLPYQPQLLQSLKKSPLSPPSVVTVYLGGGKKQKINKVDIVGTLLQSTQLEKDDLGKIEVQDYTSFIAINRERVHLLLPKHKSLKIKKKLVKIDLAH